MEIWKDIEGYEGLYQISNLGRVRSLARATTSGKVLKQMKKHGYMNVCFSKNNVDKYFRVHRLVALAFIPNPENKPTVNHIDGNKANNNVSNLEWATHSENETHSYRSLGKKPNRPWAGKPRKFARAFTDQQVRDIRKDKRPSREIGKEYGVSKTTILNIKAKKIYKEIF